MPRLARTVAASARTVAAPRPSSSSSSSLISRTATPLASARAAAPAAPRAPRPSPTLFRAAPARSLLASHRPSLVPSPSSPASPILALLAAQSPASAFVPEQRRFAVYGAEYQPSQVRRKRKHGFLARKRSKSGKKTLQRRWNKGRKFLSH
ncbi:mitochondrial 54S ribosomal protein bL34m MRX14 [Rhodotorula paludigena]|uniref:mitochondrial 54S ribosomal protein bL34m MRX14 n=1 Tax=Rhodotorula paludigena TaxID=86838 RepID=UPI0031800216